MASGHIGIQSESESFAKCLKGRRDEGSVAYFVKRNSYCTTSWILTDLFLELNKNNVSQVRVALSLSLFVSLARSLSFSTSLSFPPSLLHPSLSLCLRFLFFSLSFPYQNSALIVGYNYYLYFFFIFSGYSYRSNARRRKRNEKRINKIRTRR